MWTSVRTGVRPNFCNSSPTQFVVKLDTNVAVQLVLDGIEFEDSAI